MTCRRNNIDQGQGTFYPCTTSILSVESPGLTAVKRSRLSRKTHLLAAKSILLNLYLSSIGKLHESSAHRQDVHLALCPLRLWRYTTTAEGMERLRARPLWFVQRSMGLLRQEVHRLGWTLSWNGTQLRNLSQYSAR